MHGQQNSKIGFYVFACTIHDSELYGTCTVHVSTVMSYNKRTVSYNMHSTYKNSYMFRHPAAMFRKLL